MTSAGNHQACTSAANPAASGATGSRTPNLSVANAGVVLVRADATRIPLADRSVQCVVTSPPYWGLRDYGIAGQLGLEPTPDEYVARMVDVFREIWRVLRDDGCAWVNIGDSYATQTGTRTRSQSGECERPCAKATNLPATFIPDGLKPKDLVGIPWRLAFALQADGWYLRSDIIWHKPNPMPESVTDRPTKSHEYIFLLSKQERYFYDAEAVKERLQQSSISRGYAYRDPEYVSEKMINASKEVRAKNDWHGKRYIPAGRNLRSVWTICPQPFAGAHFATFPVELAARCIKAGTSEKGCCPKCGKCWERITERETEWRIRPNSYGKRQPNGMANNIDQLKAGVKVSTLGFRPACSCPAADPVPCVVLDPFSGAATTGVAALGLKRRYIGLELSPEYLEIARRRLTRPHAPAVKVARAEHHPLFPEEVQ